MCYSENCQTMIPFCVHYTMETPNANVLLIFNATNVAWFDNPIHYIEFQIFIIVILVLLMNITTNTHLMLQLFMFLHSYAMEL